MLGTFGGCPARRTPNMPRLVRARSLGHVRRALRGPPRLAALADVRGVRRSPVAEGVSDRPAPTADRSADRKSTRLNSSHGYISYAVFCLKKKKKQMKHTVVLSVPQ